MIIWSGWGILTPVIVMLMALIGGGIGSIFLGNAGSKGNWFIDVFIVLSSVIIWKVGKYFNRNANEVYANQATGETRRVGNRHTFFFIPMQYWAVGVIILEIVTIFA
ncbi:hypothetical protein [Pseudobacteroides cellulosolvens]|uniref:Uncharacterized protein n=1 Tax=Pseudobacteroides cellulosolvens ATCC 35603 = DSM 2933 TaxID=398512 RepID=A0A0L6JJS8_9FIRM|nr:hypothetical protein [Pseudobacteroides cellulosolvens]KNY26136.1 hypothetical protein Bccel_1398 [Pseudobacteroides cellulosolvens ATCC 35603 = DSM 2933]